MIEIFKKRGDELVKLEHAEAGCWINVYPPFNHETLERLSEGYDIPLDFLTDSLDIDERSRFEYEDGIKLVVLNTPIQNEGEVVPENQSVYITIPIGIMLFQDMVLTISPYKNPVIDSFINQRVKNFDPADRRLFILQLFDRNVYYFLHYLKQINNKRNHYEEELFHSSRNEELSQLMNLQKSLVYFVTTIRSNELMMMKIERTDFLDVRNYEEKMDFLQDIIVDNSQALEMSNIYTNILNSTMDTFSSIISNNLNQVMRRLTSVTIILMLPTLVASFYGMNIELPMMHSTFAFPFILMLSLLLSVMFAWWFMRKRWF